MNRKAIIILIRNTLKNLSLDTLQDIQKKLNAGELTDVFESALDDAIESKIADNWQDGITAAGHGYGN